MAGTITHAFFVCDVFNNLDNKTKTMLKNHIKEMQTYGQSHDILFFSAKKKIRDLGNNAQENKTQIFFINMINYIKDNNLKYNREIISFLYGYICHYVLDYTVHPFIKYKTGIYRKNDKNTYKYRCKHDDMESYIDAMKIYDNMHIKPEHLKTEKFALDADDKTMDLINLIEYSYKETYEIDNMGKEFFKSLKNMKILYKIFRNDYYGSKKKIYNFIDKITFKKTFKLSPVSLAYKIHEKDFYLNNEHSTWNHPMYKNETYNYSFNDLYKNAVKEASQMINTINNYLFKDQSVNLTLVFKDISFSTGKVCKDKTIEKYFEY